MYMFELSKCEQEEFMYKCEGYLQFIGTLAKQIATDNQLLLAYCSIHRIISYFTKSLHYGDQKQKRFGVHWTSSLVNAFQVKHENRRILFPKATLARCPLGLNLTCRTPSILMSFKRTCLHTLAFLWPLILQVFTVNISSFLMQWFTFHVNWLGRWDTEFNLIPRH